MSTVRLQPRPKRWHCIFCGWKCRESFNDYICKQCSQLRPFLGGSATMITCGTCGGFNLAVATCCEWCGSSIDPDSSPRTDPLPPGSAE